MIADSDEPTRAEGFRDLVATRRSVRALTDRQVDEMTLRRVFDVAARSPSWCNVQAWRAFLIQGEHARKLSDEMLQARQNRESNPDLPFIKDFSEPYRQRKRRTDQFLRETRTGSTEFDARIEIDAVQQNWRFFGAPQAVILTVPTDHLPYALVDLGCFLQTLLLGMHSEGLSACAQGALAHFPHVIRRHLPIPDTETIVCGVSFGYEDLTHPRLTATDRADTAEWLWGLPNVPTPTQA